MAADPHRGDHPYLSHLHAGGPQRREPGQRRRGQGVEGGLPRVQVNRYHYYFVSTFQIYLFVLVSIKQFLSKQKVKS